MVRYSTYTLKVLRGRSSVVERHVANVNVVSSNLIARFIRGVGRSVGTGRAVQGRNWMLFVYSLCEVPAK